PKDSIRGSLPEDVTEPVVGAIDRLLKVIARHEARSDPSGRGRPGLARGRLACTAVRPLGAEDRHAVDVVVLPGPVDAVAERRLVDEPQPLVQATGVGVRGVHVEPDALEAELLERKVQERADRVAALAL